MYNLAADFIINLNNPIEAEFEIGETEHFDCSFELFAAGTVWGSIDGDISNQTDLQNALNLKADKIDLDADVELINQTINENYTDLNNKITVNHNEITSLNQLVQSYGDIVTYDAADFATAAQGVLANTALQPGDNISELVNNAGYITSADLPTLEDLTTQAQMNAINSGATSVNIAQIASNTQAISTETLNRQSADNGLQSQIDAIVASSDVFDIVGTYAELQAYDIATVPPNDIIKVLVDSTHNNAATYYRCVETGGVKSWSYIGSEGAYYTKSEADGRFVPLERTINGKALSNNITLDATDVGALSSSTVIPTVNDGTLTIQVNGTSVGTFTANQSGNTTANIVVPDSATWGNITGDIGDQTDLQNALNGKQDVLTAGTDLEIVEGSTFDIPDDYTQVEYLNMPEGSYIDTGITKSDFTYPIINTKFRRIKQTDADMFGTKVSENGMLVWDIAANSTYFRYGRGASAQNVTYQSGHSAANDFTFTTPKVLTFGGSANATPIYVDGVLVGTCGTTQPNFSVLSATNSICINRARNANSNCQWYYFRIYDYDMTLVYEGVPVKRNLDSVLGMYDTVSRTFKTNAGTGTFVAGAEIPDSTVIRFTNDTGYITGINSTDVTTALGYIPVNPSNLATVATSGDYDDLTNKPTIPPVGDGTITITQGGVTKGTFTTNQSGNSTIALDAGGGGGSYSAGTGIVISNDTISIDTSVVAQLSDIPTNYVTTDTAQNISGRKTFLGEKAIYFKQSATTNKLGFTLYNPSDTELGAFEWRPSTIGGGALLNINVPYSSSNYVGFRYWGTAVNIIAPKVATAGNYYIPVNITDGTNTVTANSSGTVDISSLVGGGGSGGIQNTATGTDSLTILGTASTADYSVNIGINSEINADEGVAIGCEASTYSGVAIGRGAEVDSGGGVAIGKYAGVSNNGDIAIGDNAGVNGTSAIALGYQASATASNAIQIGNGENTTSNTMQVWNYSLLNKTTGLIPDARLSSNIARTSQIPTVPTNVSAFTNDSGYITSSALNGYVQNTATGSNSLTIEGYTTSANNATNVGAASRATRAQATAFGKNAEATAQSSTALGGYSVASADYSIQIGYGTNSNASTLSIGFANGGGASAVNFQLLDGITGLIPDARLSSNIARTANVADTTLSNVSSIDSNSAVKTALDDKLNTADVWYDSTTSTLNIGVAQV